MVVLYYTCPYYLDTAIETIQSIKNEVDLHVIIEITPACKNSTLINIESLEGLNEIDSGENVLGKKEWSHFATYFEGVKSVEFIIHPNRKSFTWESVARAFRLGKYLKKYKADIVHIDTLTTRMFGLYPFIRFKKMFITIHDPMPHSGEASWKENLPNWAFLSWAKGYFFYSEFARRQFSGHFKYVKARKEVIRFQPVTYLSQFFSNQKPEGETILFFGRLSVYKGIDLLVEAIPEVLKSFPDQKFVIAGMPVPGFTFDKSITDKYRDNVEIIMRFLGMDELVKYIERAKFVVCPYRDATQSGVLMTAQAVGKMVLATDVGSFAEYIEDNVNGMLTTVDSAALAKKIKEALAGNKYKDLEKKLTAGYSRETGKWNEKILMNAYKNF